MCSCEAEAYDEDAELVVLGGGEGQVLDGGEGLEGQRL